MKHPDESTLKAELDEISRNIDEIMNRIDAVLPDASEQTGTAESAPDGPDDQ